MKFLDNFRNSGFFYAITDMLYQEYGDAYSLEPKGKGSLKVMVEGICIGQIIPTTRNERGAKDFKYQSATGIDWIPNVVNIYEGDTQYG